MRPLLSWLLIAILSTHWMGGYICFQMEYVVEIRDSMSTVELMIAEALEEEMGTGIHIDLVDQAQMEAHSFGYSGRFIFSEEVNGQVYHFEIVSDPVDISYQKHSYSPSQLPTGDKDKAVAFEWRFSKFTIQNSSFVFPVQEMTSRNYGFQDFRPVAPPSIPTPPPKQYA